MSLVSDFNGLHYAGREKFSVRFSISGHGLIEFETAEQGRLAVALQSSRLELIGDPNTTLQISWSTPIGRYALLCKEPEIFDKLLSLNLPQPAREHVTALQTKQRRNLTGEKHRVPVYLGLIAAFFVGGYFTLHYSAPLIADLIPYEWEQKIGAFAFENYQMGKKTVTDKTATDAVNAIVKRIDQFDGADIEYRVAVVDADMINAFAFPGGYVVVTTGLIENADNPEQVAGVLAHELTHVLQRHSMRKLVRQAGMGVLIGIVFGDLSALSQLIELSSQLDSLSFDRSQERSADDGAIEIMTAAGLSPQNLAAFFEKIQKADALTGNIPELFQTHPLTDERIKRVSSAAEPAQPFTFDMDWQQVKHGVQ
ncbi:MAG: M48 family metallopeptidase [Methylomonas sp.]|jgi:Zn-dependent protease with chaperone function|uniref:M48 family metallopeptidase n=1 Tax=Methylomonas sp. TaxID=418 RepID=UPI0025F1507B|nr:M48 family metallopeptidase [Methylomonas sp.]MCK9605752.1 M48 family metallopeptidase [Methylomonas sp.]